MDPIYEPATGHDEIPHVASPYEGKKMGVGDHLIVSSFWFGTNFLWGAMLGPVLASQMATLAPKNSAAMLGYLYTIGAFPALLIPLVMGALSDRCTHPMGRRRPYILWGAVGGLLGLILMIVATNAASLPLYFVGWLVLQFGMNTAIAAYSGIIPDLVPEEQRGIASGYMALMSNIATLAGTLLGAFMIKSSPMIVYGGIIAMLAVFTIVTVLCLRENQLNGPVPRLDWGKYLRSLVSVLVDFKDFRWVWITRALMMIGFYAIQPYILFYLRDVIKLEDPEAKSGIMLMIILIGATVSAMIGGSISDKTGRKPVVYWATGIISVMSLVFIVCNSFVTALIAGVIFGLGYGAYISVDWALGADVLPARQHAAKDMAVWHVAMTLPQQISPLIAGLILSQFTVAGTSQPVRYQSTGFAVVFVFAAVMFAFSGILLRNVKGAR